MRTRSLKTCKTSEKRAHMSAHVHGYARMSFDLTTPSSDLAEAGLGETFGAPPVKAAARLYGMRDEGVSCIGFPFWRASARHSTRAARSLTRQVRGAHSAAGRAEMAAIGSPCRSPGAWVGRWMWMAEECGVCGWVSAAAGARRGVGLWFGGKGRSVRMVCLEIRG